MENARMNEFDARILPPDDPQRRMLHNEVHARPPEPLATRMAITHVVMLANEAAEVVQQGIASVQDTDLAMVNGVNYPRGPLAWADTIGPAVLQRVLANLAASYGEERYRSSPLLARRALTGQPFYREQEL